MTVVLSLFKTMGLGVDVVLGPFFIHRDDVLLPFGIGVGNSESDVHNDLRIGSGYPLADCLDQHSSFRLIIPLSCQFGLSLHLSEEEIGGTGHSDLPHLFLMDEFDGGVTELFPYQVAELVPIWESVMGPSIEWQALVVVFIVVVVVIGGIDVLIV